MELNEQVEQLRRERNLAGIFMDFDGTFAPIVDDRDSAAIIPEGPAVLAGLARLFPLVAFISGRGAADLHARVGVDGLRYFGLYGAEEMTPAGLVQSPMAPRWRQTAQALAAQAQNLIREEDLDGCEAEFKDLAVSLHYRHSGQSDPPGMLVEWAREAALANNFRLGVGRMVLELKPGPVSKAAALQRIAVQNQLQHAVVGGDDAADVEMMQRAAQIIPGVLLRVGVSSGEAPAGLVENSDLRVGSPQEMVEFLERLL